MIFRHDESKEGMTQGRFECGKEASAAVLPALP